MSRHYEDPMAHADGDGQDAATFEPRVIVVVRGGVVQSVHSDAPLALSILDYDNMEAEEDGAELLHYYSLEEECESLPEVL